MSPARKSRLMENDITTIGYLSGVRYRAWSRLLHRVNLHHTQRSGPMEDGRYLHWCHWCGMRRMETPDWVVAEEMRAAATERPVIDDPDAR